MLKSAVRSSAPDSEGRLVGWFMLVWMLGYLGTCGAGVNWWGCRSRPHQKATLKHLKGWGLAVQINKRLLDHDEYRCAQAADLKVTTT